MITEAFDNKSKPLITPANIYRDGRIAEKCIVTFSGRVLADVKKRFDLRLECQSGTANGSIKVYSFVHKDEKILFYMSPIGSACAGTILDEVRFLTGATKFIFFGSCGLLSDVDELSEKIIVPTEAYRDEGFSYHFAKPADFIKIKNSEILENKLQKLNIPFVTGKTWTTDAIYMETENKIAKHKSEGCISVEMECAGLQALCNYRGFDLYIFFFASDLVSSENWKNINLGTDAEKVEQMNCFDIALKLAKEI